MIKYFLFHCYFIPSLFTSLPLEIDNKINFTEKHLDCIKEICIPVITKCCADETFGENEEFSRYNQLLLPQKLILKNIIQNVFPNIF